MTDTTTDLIQRYAAEIERIIDAGTDADHTWVGLLSAFMQEYAGDHVPTFTDLHAFLDLASFRDHLSVTVANGDDTLTARIEGSVLAADPAVCIDLLDGAPYVLRKERGIVWAPVRCATLSRDGQTIATYLEAQQTPQEVTTAPQTAPQPEPGHGDGGEAAGPNLNAQTGYTPTTDDVRDEWIESGQGSPTVRLHAGAAFDRWLAAHDAEVAAQALRDAHPTLPNDSAALDALPVGTVLRGVDQDGDLTVAMRSATGDWASVGASLEVETASMQTHGRDYGITEWTVIYHPEEDR